jgi:hypothetical protein
MTKAELSAAVEIVDRYIIAAGGADFRPMTARERACVEALRQFNHRCRQARGEVVH